MGDNPPNMNMPGMAVGHVGARAATANLRRGALAHVGGGGAHAVGHLIPEWLGVVGACVFLVIAASHLRHLARTDGQRRPWHACHVLVAVGMAFMYAPGAIDPLRVPVTLWLLVFAAAGGLAGLWALSGGGRVPTLIWLLTSIDLGAMMYMWSPHPGDADLGWLLVAYFTAQAGMWALDAYRRIDGRTPIVSWNLMSDASGGAALSVRTVRTVASESLIGDVDIGVSMIVMTLGMAYMLAAMLAM